MHWTNIGLILVAGLDLGMALLIWLRNPRNKINVSFALATIFVGIWSMGSGMLRESITSSGVILWGIILNLGAILLTVFFLLFTFYFPYQIRIISFYKKLYIIISTSICIIILFVPNLWFFRDNIVINPPQNDYTINFGYYIFLMIFFIDMIWAYLNLVKKFRLSGGYASIQLLNIIISTGVLSLFGTFFGAITPLFFKLKYFWIGPYFSLPMIFLLVYFIFHYKKD